MTRTSAFAAAAALAAAAVVAAVATAGTAAAQGRAFGAGADALDFRAIDTDGDGSLSRAELQARAVARLGRADLDGDGWLDREELVVIMPGGDDAFRVFSTGRGGAMADRLLALMGATEAGRVEVTALADRRVNMLLAAIDSDRDAAISRAESDASDARRAERRHHHGDRWGDRRDDRRGGPAHGAEGGPGWGPHGDRDAGPRGPRPPMPAPGMEPPAAPAPAPAPAPVPAPEAPAAEPPAAPEL